MTDLELKEMLASDEWELNCIKAYKSKSLDIDPDVTMDHLNEILKHCDTGECLGENWHGGMTSEEWKDRRLYIKKCIETLQS